MSLKRTRSDFMSFKYKIGLSLVHPSPNSFLYDKPFEDTINYAARHYNSVCSASKNNPKEIEIIEIREKSIILYLSSEVELANPGKALRSFSQNLLKNETFQNTFMFGKQLFTSYDVANAYSVPCEKKHISAEDIDDTLFLNSLINYFFKKRDPDTKIYLRKKKAIEKMKVIAYDCGIISNDNSNICE